MSEEKVYTFNEYVLGYDSGGYNDRSCLTISKILNDNMYVMSTLYDGSAEAISTILDSLQQKVEQLEKENEKLKHKLNDIAFGDDSELALRFLRKIDYVDFDEKRKVYINKHNNEPFLWKDEQEKDYYLKDEELNEYTQQLEYKVEQLENIRKEAIDYVYKHIQKYDVDGTFTNLDEFDFIASPQVLLNILNKGDNNGRK